MKVRLNHLRSQQAVSNFTLSTMHPNISNDLQARRNRALGLPFLMPKRNSYNLLDGPVPGLPGTIIHVTTSASGVPNYGITTPTLFKLPLPNSPIASYNLDGPIPGLPGFSLRVDKSTDLWKYELITPYASSSLPSSQPINTTAKSKMASAAPIPLPIKKSLVTTAAWDPPVEYSDALSNYKKKMKKIELKLTVLSVAANRPTASPAVVEQHNQVLTRKAKVLGRINEMVNTLAFLQKEVLTKEDKKGVKKALREENGLEKKGRKALKRLLEKDSELGGVYLAMVGVGGAERRTWLRGVLEKKVGGEVEKFWKGEA